MYVAMETGPPDYIVVLRSRERRECDDARLVLLSMEIPAESVFQGGWWLLCVSPSDAPAAAAELTAYQAENDGRPAPRPPRVPVLSGGVTGLSVYVLVMVLVAMLSNRWAFGLDWKAAGAMRAGSWAMWFLVRTTC